MKNTRGFSVVEGLLILVIVGLLGGVGWYVYNANNKTTDTYSSVDSANTSSAKTKTKYAYEGWKTYTATSDGFNLKYPKDWTVTVYQPLKGDRWKSYSYQFAAPNNDGAYVLSVDTQLPREDMEDNDASPKDGTTKILDNGILVWWTDKKYIKKDAGSCVSLTIIGKGTSSYYYGYKLRNGRYLGATGSYCPYQKSSTDLSYEEQINDKYWKDGLKILESIEFNK